MTSRVLVAAVSFGLVLPAPRHAGPAICIELCGGGSQRDEDRCQRRVLADEMRSAFAVFAGKVVATDIATATIEVDAIWKGGLPRQVTMNVGRRIGESSVEITGETFTFQQNKRYVVFAFGKGLTDLGASSCGFSTPEESGGWTIQVLDDLAPRRKPQP